MDSNPGKTAVFLLAHGSPDSVEEIPEFLSQITGGRPIPAETIEEIKHRYGLIGRSPLTGVTLKQGEQLASELGMSVYVGMRNWNPLIGDAVARMVAEQIQHAVVICLAPQNSRTSVGLYRSALVESRPAFTFDFVESWHDHPLLIKAFAERLRAGWPIVCREMDAEIPVIFTAHSVPERTVTEGDPYERQAKETAGLVALEASLPAGGWTFAFQSQGMSGGAWLGPKVEDTILTLKAEGHRAIFIQPIGFLCDHVEILYDIDIAFKEFAENEGLRLWRAQSLNDSALLTAALADITRSRLQNPASGTK
jgi:ferrochelatase